MTAPAPITPASTAPSAVHGLQARLERAIANAARSDDRELAGRVRDEGHRLVSLLNGLIHTCRLYTTDNTALDGPVAELASVLRGLIGLLGSVQLVCVEDQVYVNDIRLRVRPLEQPMVDGFLAELGRHDVGAIVFQQALDGTALKGLASLLAAPTTKDRAVLAERVRSLGDVELQGRFRFHLKGEAAAARSGGQTLARAAQVAHQAVTGLAAGRLPNPLPVRRAVMEILRTLGDSPPPVVDAAATASLPPAERHLLAVCHLSLVLGRTLGLADGTLSDLGVCAMLHDVGAEDAPERTDHAFAGARRLMRQRGFHEAKVRRLLAVLDHHQPVSSRSSLHPSLFARILHIADDYDSMSADRFSRLPPVSPATAVAAMWARRGTDYDSDLLALFVRIVGRYPPGTILELEDGRWVVTVSGAMDRERFARPVVRVVREADGTAHRGAEEIDLAERPGLRIVRVLDPEPVDGPPVVPPHPVGIDVPTAPAGTPPVTVSVMATRRGELFEGVWPVLLKELHLGRESGLLQVLQGKEFRSFRFDEGEIVNAVTNVPAEQFGLLLLRLRLVKAPTLEHALSSARHGETLSHALLRLGIMDRGRLEEARAAFVRHVLFGAFEAMDGSYTFVRQPAPPAEGVTHRLGTADLILEAVRHLRDPDVIRFALGNVDRALLLSSDSGRRTTTAHLSPADAYVLSRVNGDLTAREVLSIVPLPWEQGMRSLLALLCLGAVEYRGD